MDRSHRETKHVGANSQCTRRERREHQRGSWEKPGPVNLPLTSNPIARLRRGPDNHERREGFLDFLERERDDALRTYS